MGRTGRGNYKGVAITLYSPDEEHLITLIEDKGYHFENVDVKNNELTPIKAHNTRRKRVRKDDHLTNEVKHKVRSKTKIKSNQVIKEIQTRSRKNEETRKKTI